MLADRVAVMRRGRVEQVGTPEEIYGDPACLFVAAFVGSPRMNLVQAASTPSPTSGSSSTSAPRRSTCRGPTRGRRPGRATTAPGSPWASARTRSPSPPTPTGEPALRGRGPDGRAARPRRAGARRDRLRAHPVRPVHLEFPDAGELAQRRRRCAAGRPRRSATGCSAWCPPVRRPARSPRRRRGTPSGRPTTPDQHHDPARRGPRRARGRRRGAPARRYARPDPRPRPGLPVRRHRRTHPAAGRPPGVGATQPA